jgi:hypothetical protein
MAPELIHHESVHELAEVLTVLVSPLVSRELMSQSLGYRVDLVIVPPVRKTEEFSL